MQFDIKKKSTKKTKIISLEGFLPQKLKYKGPHIKKKMPCRI